MLIDLIDIQNEDVIVDSAGQVHVAVVVAVKYGKAPKAYFYTFGTATKSTPADGQAMLLLRDGQVIGPPVLKEVTTRAIKRAVVVLECEGVEPPDPDLHDELAPLIMVLNSEQAARQSR